MEDVFVSIKEILPPRKTCCWVRFEDLEGSYPAMWDGQAWKFQIKELSGHVVSEWRVNNKGCHWY